MKFLSKHRALVAIVALFLVVVAVLPASSQRVDQVFNNLQINGYLLFKNGAALQPAVDGNATVGSDAKRFRASYVDTSQITNHVIVGDGIGGSNGAILVKFVNNSGSALAAGDWVVHDSTAVVVVDSTDANVGDVSAAIADSLESDAGKFMLVAKANGTVATDSVIVTGIKDGSTVAVADTLILTDGAESFSMFVDGTSRVYWTKINAVSYLGVNGALSVQLEAIPYANVKASVGATTSFAGVVTEAISDADSGFVCVYGPVDAVVDAATLRAQPGTLLELAANGDAVTDAAATTGQNVARAMEYSNKDNFKIRVFVGNQ